MFERAARVLLVLGAAAAFGLGAASGPVHGAAPGVVLERRGETGQGGTGGAFPDIASAIGAVADASAARPYVVRLAPGTYAVPPGGIVMKPFVDLEGSGPAQTVLEGAVAAGTALWMPPLTADQPAVVRMASNSRLRSLAVRNTSAEGGIALYFPMTVNAGAEDVTAEALGSMAPGMQYDYHAVRVQGPGADVTLDRVTARYRMEAPAEAALVGDNVAIGVFNAGKLLVRNSRAIAENGWWNIGITSEGGSESTVLDSVIEVSGRAQGAYAFSAQGTRDEARNTRMTVSCPASNEWGCAAAMGCSGSTVTVHGSDLRVIVGAQTTRPAMVSCQGTVSASRLSGPAAYEDWKLVDCTDGDSRPIPNRP